MLENEMLGSEMLERIKSELSPEWEVVDGKKLRRVFKFKGFLKTMSFVNAAAWEANKQMHHPDLEVSFNQCAVNITTHDEGDALTEKDLDLAKALDRL